MLILALAIGGVLLVLICVGLVQAVGKARCALCLAPLASSEVELCAWCAEDRKRRLETEQLARVLRFRGGKERLR